MENWVKNIPLFYSAPMFLLSGVSLYCLMTFEGFFKVEWGVEFSSMNLLSFQFLADTNSLMFSFTVFLISGSVFLYSLSYMSHSKDKVQFFFLVSLFVLSMAILIFSCNLISLIFGWDLLGFSSFLLIIFYQNKKSMEAGMLTIFINRFGDVIIFLIIVFSVDMLMHPVFSSVGIYSVGIMLLVVLAGMTKSAQFPFSSWLPAAMAAPTPVSALVHSSTLVTAGVYLIFRFSMNTSPMIQGVLFWVGLVTAFMAGFSALSEVDFKKIIALSTLSHLGLMFIGLSLGFYYVALIHLISHAFFKSLMFLVVGHLIHQSLDYQDLRKIFIHSSSPSVSYYVLGISSFSMCGFPFMSGFYSKDLIIEMMVSSGMNFFSLVFFYFTIMLTIFYSWRVFLSVFFSSPKCTYSPEGVDFKILFSFFFLTLLSVVGGWWVLWELGGAYKPLSYVTFGVKFFIFSIMGLSLISCYFFYFISCYKNFVWFVGNMFSIPAFNNFFLFSSSTISQAVLVSENDFFKYPVWFMKNKVNSNYALTPKPVSTLNLHLFKFVIFFLLI